jgi:CRISPR-associated endonuclease/helicase Cas3
VWLIALANGKPVPRRLVYVVNRRTVVDQTTDEVEKYRKNLAAAGIPGPLAISTLRGQFADNREWSADPSRPAVICGTVDMIGSRLLFSGYGIGFKSRPLHAGFLGQDALLVHDEAHLEPAFQDVLCAIQDEQKRCKDFCPLYVMELTATSRSGGNVFPNEEGRAVNEADETVKRRIGAKKRIEFFGVEDEKSALVKKVVAQARERSTGNAAVIVFVRSVEQAGEIARQLDKAFPGLVEQLNGTLRGYERDGLVEKAVFQRFQFHSNRDGEYPAFLVCTSAGEVGVNLSADHLVCDLSTFDSMAQRFGRVNRFGEPLDHIARIDIVHLEKFDKDEKLDDIDRRRKLTLELLRKLDGDGSPRALRDVHRAAVQEGSGTGPMSTDRTEALRKYILGTYAPQPTTLPTSDILFDAWALTTIFGKLPGRPPVEPYLHGVSGWEPPETHVAWRKEVDIVTGDMLGEYKPANLLEDYPLKPHELLREPSYRAFKHFEALAKRRPDDPAWVIADDGDVQVLTLKELANKDEKDRINGKTVLLPPAAGGLEAGMLNGESKLADDVADEWFLDRDRKERRRIRLRNGDPEPHDFAKFRLVRELVLGNPEDEDAEPETWLWYVRPLSADDDGSKTSRLPVTWDDHTRHVTDHAERIAAFLLKDRPDLQRALVVAAKFHDLGKKRVVWQRSIGHRLPKDPKPEHWLAKSGRGMKPLELTSYRHEFGSLVELESEPEFQALTEDQRELVRHLIAVHHGRGRPHFPADEAFDPERSQADAETVARGVPGRFAQLQRKYGRWGLAYLESLLRAADIAASVEEARA